GGPQFRFSRDGQVVQDWSGKPSFKDTPETASPTYSVLVRCSSDTSCTSVTPATLTLPVFDGGASQTGNGGVAAAAVATPVTLSVTYVSATQSTTLTLTGGTSYDVFRGSLTSLGAGATAQPHGFVGGTEKDGKTWQHLPDPSCFLNNTRN